MKRSRLVASERRAARQRLVASPGNDFPPDITVGVTPARTFDPAARLDWPGGRIVPACLVFPPGNCSIVRMRGSCMRLQPNSRSACSCAWRLGKPGGGNRLPGGLPLAKTDVPLQQLIRHRDYYYYHCLHFQNTEQFDKLTNCSPPGSTVQGHARHPRNSESSGSADLHQEPDKSLEFIRQRLGLQFNHQRER